jgi:NADH:ubiquinone oxidoreductase subunit 6 (subunit J)
MRILIMLAVVSIAVFALGVVLKANLIHVALGLILGGGIGGGLLALINRLQAPISSEPETRDD